MEWFSTGSGLIEFQLNLDDARQGHHQGQCDDDIASLRNVPYISETLAKINPETLRQELREYGAWDNDELANHEENLNRILWIACGDICEVADCKEYAKQCEEEA